MSNKPNTKQNHRRSAAPPPQGDPWWRSPMMLLIPLVLLAGGITLVVAATTGDDNKSTSTTQTAFAETLGAPLAPFAEPDLAIGAPAPAISAQTMQGDRVQVTADGNARLYGFFAHWCPHCQAEVPAVVDWLETNPLPDNVELVAVSTSVDEGADNYPPSDWFGREEWPTTVLLDDADGSLASGFGITAFPFWVAVDGAGTVVARISGSMPAEQLEAIVATLADR